MYSLKIEIKVFLPSGNWIGSALITPEISSDNIIDSLTPTLWSEIWDMRSVMWVLWCEMTLYNSPLTSTDLTAPKKVNLVMISIKVPACCCYTQLSGLSMKLDKKPQRPIRGQYRGHMIPLDQSEAKMSLPTKSLLVLIFVAICSLGIWRRTTGGYFDKLWT